MRTCDVKIGSEYLYKGKIVTVLKRIYGDDTTQTNMQSGELFTGFKRKRKTFLLSNGIEVYSDKLTQIYK